MNAQLMAYSIQRMAELIRLINVAKGTPDAEPTAKDVDEIADAVYEKFAPQYMEPPTFPKVITETSSILDQIVKEETERRSR